MSVKIDLKIFLWIIIFYFFHQAELYVLLIFFAFVHEIGHLTAGLLLGYEPSGIRITPVGVSINFKEKRNSYNQKIGKGNKRDIEEMIIALAGPMTNFGIIGICYLIGLKTSNLYDANFLLGVFNLCPIYPLDGGRIFKSIGNLLWGRKKSWQITNGVSNAIMIGLSVTFSIAILYFHNIGIVVMSIYLWGIVIRENRIYERRMKLYEQIEAYDQREAKREEQSIGKY